MSSNPDSRIPTLPSYVRPEGIRYARARAKYIIRPDGTWQLVQIQEFSEPKFANEGWEVREKYREIALENNDRIEAEAEEEAAAQSSADPEKARANINRAARRAKIRAFDAILCNPELDTFATFTYRPDWSLQKDAYGECYERLKPWLSNRVQRSGLEYIIVPERHKSGDIHFHGILNSSAIKLDQAFSPHTGRPIKRNGSPVFNLNEWKHGFTTAQMINQTETDRAKVAKYIFKYMGKQMGERIGGRYALMGGQLKRPFYRYGDSIEELEDDALVAQEQIGLTTIGLGDSPDRSREIIAQAYTRETQINEKTSYRARYYL